MGLATKPNPTPFENDFGLAFMSNLIAVGLADKPDPAALGTQNRKDNAPNNTFLPKNSKDNAPMTLQCRPQCKHFCTI
jgi:hypothetical protein